MPKFIVSVDLDGDEGLYYDRELELEFVPPIGANLNLYVGQTTEIIRVTGFQYFEHNKGIVLYCQMEEDILQGERYKLRDDLAQRFKSDEKWVLGTY